ncbi:MAG: hypothetical protein Q7T97_04200 [Burkholderiaceae bacterium]|nr:hypothetical protein [Burkholderiaceae bacterium]
MPVKADCDSLAAPERIEAALRKPEGQLWLPPTGGQVATPSVQAKLRDTKTLTLAQVESDSSLLTKGVSGAPVVFDGLIVGILLGNTTRDFRATRLDCLVRVAGDEVRLRRFDMAMPAALTPYDLGALPASIAEEARKARKLRDEAELVSRPAPDLERLADEAARLAEVEATNGTSLSPNRRSYATQGGDRYAGEITTKPSLFATTNTTYPQGYGVLETLTGPFKGAVNECIRVAEGRACVGPMVTEFSSTRSSWRRMEIERRDSMPSGPARIVFRLGVIGYVTVQTTHSRRRNLVHDDRWRRLVRLLRWSTPRRRDQWQRAPRARCNVGCQGCADPRRAAEGRRRRRWRLSPAPARSRRHGPS